MVGAALVWLLPAFSHAGESEALPRIRPAPAFTLITQEGTRLSLKDLRGKIVALTFIYASCDDTCPLLTAKMAGLQTRLGTDFGARVFFVSVTVDPERDTPEVLTRYAQVHGANLTGWAFLTGTLAEIRQVLRHYGIYYKKLPRGDVDHTFPDLPHRSPRCRRRRGPDTVVILSADAAARPACTPSSSPKSPSCLEGM